MASPIYYQTWPSFSAVLTAADAGDFAGTGTLVTLVSGTASGPRDVLYVRCIPYGDVTVGNVLRFFKDDGTNIGRVGQLILPNIKLSGSNPIPDLVWVPPMGVMPLKGTTDILKVSQEIANNFKFIAQCGDYQ